MKFLSAWLTTPETVCHESKAIFRLISSTEGFSGDRNGRDVLIAAIQEFFEEQHGGGTWFRVSADEIACDGDFYASELADAILKALTESLNSALGS